MNVTVTAAEFVSATGARIAIIGYVPFDPMVSSAHGRTVGLLVERLSPYSAAAGVVSFRWSFRFGRTC